MTENVPQLPEKKTRRIPAVLFYTGIGIATAYLFFRFLWKPVLPFLLGGLLAMLLQKPLDLLDGLCGHKKRIRKIWAIVLVFGCVGVLTTILLWLLNALIRECGTFFAWLGDHIGVIGEKLTEWNAWLEHVFAALPFLHANNGGTTEITEAAGEGNVIFSVLSSADELLMDMIQKAVTSATAELPVILTAAAAALPQIVLFLGVFLLASVYLTIEYREIGNFLYRTFPNKTSAVLRGLRSSLMSTVLLYGRAYTILCLITFAELYIGFRILDIDWAFGASLLGALIDLLPVIGTGTLLLPWAVFELIRGAWYRGIGLVILYIVICVIRQVLEPKIVGKNIGLHPLAALFCMYVGMKLFGIAGLFLMPMTAAVIWKYYLNRKTRDGARV